MVTTYHEALQGLKYSERHLTSIHQVSEGVVTGAAKLKRPFH